MKPKVPLSSERPFLTILTNTFRRPQGLAACLASVGRQTAAAYIEHLVLPDHVGHAPADIVYGRLPRYIDAVHGDYVHVLGDDDVLASADAVQRLITEATRPSGGRRDMPPWLVVKCLKGGTEFPKRGLTAAASWQRGDLDLCCFVLRRDVWIAAATEYARGYVCDFEFYELIRARLKLDPMPIDLLFAVGREGGGRPEMDY